MQSYRSAMDLWREERRGAQRATSSSNWTPRGNQPPDVGVIEGTDHVASFKTGGPQGDRTLIVDGDYSDDRKGFRAKHNDYGSRREGPGYFDEDRGHYTGPDH